MSDAMTNQLYNVNADGQLVCRPHAAQMEALDSKARFTMMLKGVRAGGTSITPFWMRREMKRCGPGNRTLSYLGLAPTFQVAENALIPNMRRVFCDALGWGEYFQNPKRRIQITEKGEREMWGHKQAEPTNIYFAYADDPDSFAGYTGIAAVGDEIGQKKFKFTAWMELRARLSIAAGLEAPFNPPEMKGVKMGRFFGGTTVYQLGWLEDMYNEWREYALRGEQHPELNFIRFDSTLNPLFSQEEWQRAKATLPDWLFDMRYRAIFRRPAGVIYDAWNPQKHVVDEFKLPPSWPRTCSIDFGRKNFYALFIASDLQRDRHFCYKSYHRSDLANHEHARELLAIEPNIDMCVAGQISEAHDRAQLAAGGLFAMEPGWKEFDLGLRTVAAAIKLDKFFIFKDACKGLEDELRTYSYQIDESTGLVKDDKAVEDKETYHWCDALRYFGSRRWNALMNFAMPIVNSSSPAAPRTHTSKLDPVAGNPIIQQVQQQRLRAGGGIRSRMRARRYGFDDGCVPGAHLDINI